MVGLAGKAVGKAGRCGWPVRLPVVLLVWLAGLAGRLGWLVRLAGEAGR